jgi:hypothetical protein
MVLPALESFGPMAGDVVIESRFRGPPESANGGYACGMVAAFVEPAPAVEVTLRAPPPLERPLAVTRTGDAVELRDGDSLIAEGRPAPEPEIELPEPVSLEEAERAMRTSPLYEHHPFETCFVCGPEAIDGLQVVCGPVPGRERELVAAPLRTGKEMADGDGAVRPELVWSVLDCPSGLVGLVVDDLGVSVLGRLTASIPRQLEAGRDYVAIGWPIERDGRKVHSASAILGEDGEPLAISRATWIELAEQPPS